MPKYIVKTINDRNLIIEADKFRLSPSPDSVYEFFIGGNIVASVPLPNVFVVADDAVEKGDFYFHDDLDLDEDDEDEADHEDTCLDCRLDTFLESEAFFDEVSSIVDFLKNEEEPEDPIQKWVKGDYVEYGFQTPKGFVNFGPYKNRAEDGLKQYQKGESNWAYLSLTGYTQVKESE